MTSKHDKGGPSLYIPTPAMLAGLETLALQFKNAGDNYTYDFLMQIKTGESKYPVIAKHINEIAALQRIAAKALVESADYIEQLFPIIKTNDCQEKSAEDNK